MRFKYLYGPVQSWRMGKSLGIDPLSDSHKICNLDCVYCQLGKTRHLVKERKVYVPTEAITTEVDRFFNQFHHIIEIDPTLSEGIDYITFSGRGEPTLASNLGEMIKGVRKIRNEKIAVITNSTLMSCVDVRRDLLKADYVLAKLDASSEHSFRQIDQAPSGLGFQETLKGLLGFSKEFRGKLAIQIMFIKENKDEARYIADLIKWIRADEVQINTPLRPSAVDPLGREEINRLKIYFRDLPVVTVGVYDRARQPVQSLDTQDTIKRHGNYTLN